MAGNTIVGLDIGSTSIRAVEAVQEKDGPHVNNFGTCAVPTDSVIGGMVKNQKAVAEALRHLWSTSRFGTRSVVLGVSHPQAIVREVELANLPRRELKESLPFQVRDVLPVSVDHVVMDFYPLEDPAKGERRDTVKGLLIAAPKDAVIEMVEAVQRAELTVEGVDLACFATMRACAFLNHDTEAIVDIGANATSIVIHTDGVPRIVRSLPRGGNDITKMLSVRLGVPLHEAEALKCEMGLVQRDESALPEVIREAVQPLFTEIRSSLNYYASTHGEDRVKRVALAGGAALLPGLDTELTDSLSVPTFLSDTLQRVHRTRKHRKDEALGRLRSSAAVAIGLVLGAA